VWGTRSDGGALHLGKTVHIREGETTEVVFDEPERTLVEGRVTSDGGPRAGVAIAAVDPWRDPEFSWFLRELTPASARTDEDGTYRLALGGGTRYFLLLQEENGRGQAQVEVVLPESAASFRLDVPLPPAKLAGVVVYEGTAIPVSDLLVEAFDSELEMRSYLALVRARRGRCKTDLEGRFAIDHLPRGVYSVRVVRPYSMDVWAHGIQVEEGEPAEIRIELDSGHFGSLRVMDSRGYPVAGASAIVRDQGRNLLDASELGVGVGRAGQISAGFDLPLPPSGGSCEVTVIHPGHAPARFEVPLGGQAPSRTVTLSAGGSLRAIVEDSAGNPVSGSEIVVLDGDGRNVLDDHVPIFDPRAVHPQAPPLTGREGVVTLPHLRAGRYRVTATKGTARSDEVEAAIEEGGVATVRVVLRDA
jgi:hypothetical protein